MHILLWALVGIGSLALFYCLFKAMDSVRKAAQARKGKEEK